MSKLFHAFIRGEDGTEFTREHEANSPEEVFDWAEEMWPEAIVLDVFEPSVRAQEVYERAVRRMDDEDVYGQYD